MSYTSIAFYPGPREATILLNRPPLNVISLDMIDELHAALDEVEALDARVVVLSARGDAGFSAGVDVLDHAPDRVSEMLRKFNGLIRRIRGSNFVAVAAIY